MFVWRVQLTRYNMEVRQCCWLVLSKRQQEETTQGGEETEGEAKERRVKLCWRDNI